ncbi:hypothetical protein E8E15_000593 [Penicillium rubens]|nr:hypothetical protein E8E15_000593 [Penicillium rubens]KAI2669703.1 hypothetical protein LCP963914a_9891 [Penicillium roqueforti]
MWFNSPGTNSAAQTGSEERDTTPQLLQVHPNRTIGHRDLSENTSGEPSLNGRRSVPNESSAGPPRSARSAGRSDPSEESHSCTV